MRQKQKKKVSGVLYREPRTKFFSVIFSYTQIFDKSQNLTHSYILYLYPTHPSANHSPKPKISPTLIRAPILPTFFFFASFSFIYEDVPILNKPHLWFIPFARNCFAISCSPPAYRYQRKTAARFCRIRNGCVGEFFFEGKNLTFF